MSAYRTYIGLFSWYQPPPETCPSDSLSVDPASSSTTMTDSGTPKFGQNHFSLIITNDKIKLNQIEMALSDQGLPNDSVLFMEKLYSSFMRAISFGLNSGIHFVPAFWDLNRDIDFKHVFLQNLHGFTLAKYTSIYDRIGEMIKDRLQSNDWISSLKSPKASVIIKLKTLDNGWMIFQNLLCQRLVLCGALLDFDLDEQCSSLTF